MRVLIVEDNQETAESLGYYLKLLKYEVLVANTALEARSLANTNDFDVAMVDYCLKESENGLDFLKWLRENAFNQPVAIVTGADISHKSQISEEVALYSRVLVVQKPVDGHKVIEKLRAMI